MSMMMIIIIMMMNKYCHSCHIFIYQRLIDLSMTWNFTTTDNILSSLMKTVGVLDQPPHTNDDNSTDIIILLSSLYWSLSSSSSSSSSIELSVNDAVKHCLDLITNSYGHYGDLFCDALNEPSISSYEPIHNAPLNSSIISFNPSIATFNPFITPLYITQFNPLTTWYNPAFYFSIHSFINSSFLYSSISSFNLSIALI